MRLHFIMARPLNAALKPRLAIFSPPCCNYLPTWLRLVTLQVFLYTQFLCLNSNTACFVKLPSLSDWIIFVSRYPSADCCANVNVSITLLHRCSHRRLHRIQTVESIRRTASIVECGFRCCCCCCCCASFCCMWCCFSFVLLTSASIVGQRFLRRHVTWSLTLILTLYTTLLYKTRLQRSLALWESAVHPQSNVWMIAGMLFWTVICISCLHCFFRMPLLPCWDALWVLTVQYFCPSVWSSAFAIFLPTTRRKPPPSVTIILLLVVRKDIQKMYHNRSWWRY